MAQSQINQQVSLVSGHQDSQAHHQNNHSIGHDMGHMSMPANSMQDMNGMSDMTHMNNCCSGGANCSMPSCLFIVLSMPLDLAIASQSYPIDSSYYHSIPNSPVSSLYRPPIVA